MASITGCERAKAKHSVGVGVCGSETGGWIGNCEVDVRRAGERVNEGLLRERVPSLQKLESRGIGIRREPGLTHRPGSTMSRTLSLRSESASVEFTRARSPLALPICPDLNALLEHDERERVRARSTSTSRSLMSSPSIRSVDSSPREELSPVNQRGLPPPPREKQQQQRPSSALPPMHVRRLGSKLERPSTAPTPSTSITIFGNQGRSESESESFAGEPATNINPFLNPTPTPTRSSFDSLSTVTEGRAEEKGARGRHRFQSPPRDRQSSRDSSSGSRGDRPRAASVAVGSVRTNGFGLETARDCRHPASVAPFDADACEGDKDKMTTRPPSQRYSPPPPQPSRSHTHRSSQTSLRSSSSSSFGPASSSSEPRISISSTIYASDAYGDSVDNEIYRNPLPMSDNPSQYLVLSNPDRASFIDLRSPESPDIPVRRREPSVDAGSVSPSMPTFSLPLSDSGSFDSDLHHPHRARPRDPPYSSAPPRTTKPPLPTSPKPRFKRSRSAQPRPTETSSSPSPTGSLNTDLRGIDALPPPPTTNLLNSRERAELIRKTRKLTKLFGTTPSASDVSPQALSPSSPVAPAPAKRGHHRGAVSMVDNAMQGNKGLWPPPDSTQFLSASRRFSSPVSPDQLSFLSVETPTRGAFQRLAINPRGDEPVIDIGRGRDKDRDRDATASDADSRYTLSPGATLDSPTSFMDLSDEDYFNEDLDGLSTATSPEFPKQSFSGGSSGRRHHHKGEYTRSMLENLSPEERAEEERRRKREKLAKLHRFLGSRVPTDLVLGLADHVEEALPPAPIEERMSDDDDDEGGNVPRIRIPRRRRSSSGAAFPPQWSESGNGGGGGGGERMKEDLSEREKAINVKRAMKMEKMFGVLPPQTLYHTRHQSSNSPSTSTSPLSTSPNGTNPNPTKSNSLPLLPSSSPPPRRNMNQGAYSKSNHKGKGKSHRRPGTSESSKGLLGRESMEFSSPQDAEAEADTSQVYLHYRSSLRSLNDMIDRDDRQSLAELHHYLNTSEAGNHLPPASDDARQSALSPTESSSSFSIRSARRRSLPPRTSLLSLASEYSVGSPDPEMSSFQVRRRKAAKLTHFFGVDYREVIADVLESIERGVEDEGGRGTLKPDEVQDLLVKLRKIKSKRDVLS